MLVIVLTVRYLCAIFLYLVYLTTLLISVPKSTFTFTSMNNNVAQLLMIVIANYLFPLACYPMALPVMFYSSLK